MKRFAIAEVCALVLVYLVAGWISWKWDWPVRVKSWHPEARAAALVALVFFTLAIGAATNLPAHQP